VSNLTQEYDLTTLKSKPIGGSTRQPTPSRLLAITGLHQLSTAKKKDIS